MLVEKEPAYREGREDFAGGYTRSQNPYHIEGEHENAAIWEIGWMAAMFEEQEKARG